MSPETITNILEEVMTQEREPFGPASLKALVAITEYPADRFDPELLDWLESAGLIAIDGQTITS